MSKHDQHPSKKNKKRILFICKKRHVYGETEKGTKELSVEDTTAVEEVDTTTTTVVVDTIQPTDTVK
jgi:hypothetical protein